METKKRNLFQLAVALGIALLLLAVPQTVHAIEQAQASTDYIMMHRLYNPYSGEHLYTKDSNEVEILCFLGWRSEGEAWKAPTSGTAVYRLYNPNNGDHHYTLDKNEYNTLGRIGWRKEGVAWYSDSNKGVAVYRLFNPSQKGAGSHHYTTDKNEYKVLKTKGWNQEGISWYGVNLKNTTETTTTTPSKPTAKYSYELYTTATSFYTTSSDPVFTPIFIKTDNPEYYTSGKATFYITSDKGVSQWQTVEYSDVEFLDDGTYVNGDSIEVPSGYLKVEGGFLTTIGFEDPGTFTLPITENINGKVEGLGKATVTVQDTDKCAEEWQYTVINQVTTDDMDPFEKMEAISNFLLSDFKYYKNDGSYVLCMIADRGLPYFVKKEWDSFISPRVLCQFAEKIGSFDEIYNCYYGDDWALHDEARLTIGDETRYFSACPDPRENMIKNVTKVNLYKSNLLRKL